MGKKSKNKIRKQYRIEFNFFCSKTNNNMRKTMFIFCLLGSLLTKNAMAQGYLRIGGGYSISASKDVFTLPVVRQDSNYMYHSDENIYGTIGSGGSFRLAGGYAFAQNFGLELDVNYLIGTKKSVGDQQFTASTNLSFAYTRQLRITPSFFVRASKGVVQPFAGAGVVLPLVGTVVVEEQITTASNAIYKERDIYGAFSLGFESYVGANIAWPNENFSFFVELRYSSLRIKSKKSELTQWSETELASGDVTDLLATARAYQTNVIFVDKLTPESNTVSGTVLSTNFDFDKPLDIKASITNFNALGLNIGVRMNLVKAAKAEG